MSFPLNADRTGPESTAATDALGYADLRPGHVRDDVAHKEATVNEMHTWTWTGTLTDVSQVAEPHVDHEMFVDFGGDEDVVLPWQEQALCAQTDPEAFFPEKGGSTREAKRVCSRCEVRADCLSFALARDERFGIWGGLSERERRRLKRRAV